MRLKGLNIRVPRLGTNRHGMYYVRSSVNDVSGRRRVTQQSLGTKDPLLAKVLALKFCLNLVSEELMADLHKHNSNYEIDLASGKVTASGPEDHAQALAMFKALQDGGSFENMLRRHIPPHGATDSPSADAGVTSLVAQAQANLSKPNNAGLKLQQALEKHLVEEARTLKSERTVKEKTALYAEFAAFFGDVYINQIIQGDITERWRISEFARDNQKYPGKKLSLSRLEKRRGYLSKFFEWAQGGGKYSHTVNPVAQKMAKKKEI